MKQKRRRLSHGREPGTGPHAGPADGDASTREALLLAARSVFAERGFDAASVRTITAAANANLGAITYHFGTKRALYDAVVDGAVGPLADRLTALIAEPRPALERACGVVRAMFETFEANPDTPRLMLQELANGRMLPEPALRHMGRLFRALTKLIEDGHAEGSMRAGEPRLMALTIIAHPVHANLFRNVLRGIAGVDLSEAGTRARVIANAEAFVRGGLAAWPQEGGTT